MKKQLKIEKKFVANTEATELHELVSGYTDEQIFIELQKRGYFGEMTKKISNKINIEDPF